MIRLHKKQQNFENWFTVLSEFYKENLFNILSNITHAA